MKISISEYLKEYRAKLKKRKSVKVPEEKKCLRCKTVKSNSEFYLLKDHLDGLDVWCKKCKIEHNRETKDILYKANKKFRQSLKNRKDDEIKYPKKKRCYICKDVKKAKEFYKCRSRKSGLSDACKICINNDRSINKHKKNEYVKQRRKTDLKYKIYGRMQGGIHNALKNQGLRKSKRTEFLVGCDAVKFIEYIESLWDGKMNWGNYGKDLNKWSIDHIKPCAAFDLTKEEQQKECFHYSNLQPLWNKDNFSKSSWYNGRKYSKNSRD